MKPLAICRGCLRWDKENGYCKAYGILDPNCKIRIVDKLAYLRELKSMLKVNEKTHNTKYYRELRREYDKVHLRWEIEFTKEIYKAYKEDIHRGTGGSKSENGGGNRNLKQTMKDNRDRDCKPSLVAQREYHEALQSWQESHDTKLEVHKSVGYGINHSKIDSYVGREQDKLGIIPTPEELKKAMDKLIDDGMDEEVVIKALTQVKTSMTQGQKSFRRSL